MFERPLERVPIEQSGYETRPTSLSFGDDRFIEVTRSMQRPEAFGQVSLLEDSIEILPIPED